MSNQVRKGDPVRHIQVKIARKGCHDKFYSGHGCSSLYPFELRMIRTYLLPPGLPLTVFVANLGFFVFILLSTTQLMRSDESSSLLFDSFLPNFFLEEPSGRLLSLALKFIGKTDQQPVHQWVNVDHDHLDLDPVRHLLLYVYLLAKLTGQPPSGYLFMPPEDLQNPPNNGIFLRCIKKSSLRTTFYKVLQEVLGDRGEHFKMGLHMFRKGGYSLRLWALGFTRKDHAIGKLEWLQLKEDARHSRDEDAINYAECAWSTTRLLVSFNDERNRVSQTQPIRFYETDARAHCLNQSRIKGWSLDRVAKDYIERKCGLYTNHYELFSRLFRKESTVCYSHLREQFIPTLAPHQVQTFLVMENELRRQLHQQQLQQQGYSQPRLQQPHQQGISQQRQHQQVQQPPAHDRDDTDDVGGGTDNTTTHSEDGMNHQGTRQRPRGFGEEDLEIRKTLSGESSWTEVVQVLHQVESLLPTLGPNALTNAAKKWKSNTYTPAMNCLNNHHGGNDAVFVAHWSSSEWHNEFKKKLCLGKEGHTCGIH
jgi:hypothetical protein